MKMKYIGLVSVAFFVTACESTTEIDQRVTSIETRTRMLEDESARLKDRQNRLETDVKKLSCHFDYTDNVVEALVNGSNTGPVTVLENNGQLVYKSPDC